MFLKPANNFLQVQEQLNNIPCRVRISLKGTPLDTYPMDFGKSGCEEAFNVIKKAEKWKGLVLKGSKSDLEGTNPKYEDSAGKRLYPFKTKCGHIVLRYSCNNGISPIIEYETHSIPSYVGVVRQIYDYEVYMQGSDKNKDPKIIYK
ncbi:hypothetical protein COEREDRAFT_89637 [Coemansia reversa NRRL 1564]|uniref:Uncharacterized protein n=1 Tax=Coemansia reversa (strain ATCC 12441 / NRRL 1564) TaxID=763665 RepID=A0A2G5B3S1_COERN|nr:hypothetical protein COEREDRAFT_89637 [Coemansia reversa NRRL 1564]|eukprot:PIA13357.1 hypothetical protein COEREDRAFT_89637 [Coemansia reversa NRRL 1564]